MKRTAHKSHPAGTDMRARRLAELAQHAVIFLAGDSERLSAFLAVTGTDPAGMRRAVDDPAFCRGILSYVSADEPLLIAFAAELGIRPEELGQTIASFEAPSD